MSKRILAVFLMLGVLAGSNAFASRSRGLVMGNADPLGVLSDGSFYYDDNRDIFYNPSYANDFKNWASIEKSNGSGSAEGGFVANFMNFNFGFEMNRGTATPGGVYTGASAPVRPFDLTIAGDMGWKWGLGYTHSGSRISDTTGSKLNTVRAGVQVAGFEPWFDVTFASSQTVAGVEATNSGFGVGAKYKWGEWAPFAGYRNARVKPATGVENKNDRWGLGLGRNTKLAEGVTLNYAVSVWANTTTKQNVVPIDMSVEGELTSWLTGRAGFQYRLYDRSTNVTNADTTTGRIGASINVNKVNFEWAVGRSDTAAAYSEATALDTKSFDLANGFFSSASMTYHW